MPECHSCPHDGRRSSACLKCKGPEQATNAASTARGGVNMLSLDALSEHRHEADYRTAHELPQPIQNSKCRAMPALPQKAIASLLDFFNWWLRLTPKTRDTIALKIINPEKSKREIARIVHITPQHVSGIIARYSSAMKIRVIRNKPR